MGYAMLQQTMLCAQLQARLQDEAMGSLSKGSIYMRLAWY